MITAQLGFFQASGVPKERSITAELKFFQSNGSALRTTILLSQGIRGATGPAGAAEAVTAAENLGGHRAITADGFLCTPATSDKLVGITTGAAMTGGLASYVSRGRMVEGSWNWTPNAPIFLGAAGVLTQVPLTTGPIRRIAWAISATEINVDFAPTITQA